MWCMEFHTLLNAHDAVRKFVRLALSPYCSQALPYAQTLILIEEILC